MAERIPHSEPHPDVAGYLLGTLQDDETRTFLDHLDSCDACRVELDQLAGLPELLTDVPDSWSLPAGLEDRAFAAVEAAAQGVGAGTGTAAGTSAGTGTAAGTSAGTGTAAGTSTGTGTAAGTSTGTAAGTGDAGELTTITPITAARRRSRGPRRPQRLLIAAAAAAAVIIAGVATLSSLRTSTPAPLTTIRLISADGGPAHGSATVRTTPAGLTIDMTVDGLAPTPKGRIYTCWLVANDDTLAHPDRVSVGSFLVRGRTVHVHWTSAADLERFPHLGVTVEPDNGNPSHQGPKVLIGS
ncbi:MAG: Anti-sigma-K factor rskA [Acidimicrobiaceae bacterium]|nr:Anti-sigma-K factor rskA [Acidimicrobiaceae bacterium]